MRRHPWHPALVHFPVACWILATVFDAAEALGLPLLVEGAPWASTATLMLLSGLVMGLPAVLAGVIDYLHLPRDVRESVSLAYHVVAMGTAFLLFSAAALVRLGGIELDANGPLILGLEIFGSVCLVVGGFYASRVVFERLPASAAAGTLLIDTGDQP